MSLILQFWIIIILYIQGQSQSQLQQIECIGVDACKKKTIQCAPHKACSIICNGKSACTELIFIGTASTNVNMLCSPDDSCKKATVACGTGKCSIDCIAEPGKTVCNELDVIINQAISFQCTNACPIDIQQLTFTVSPTPSPTHNPSITPTKNPSIITSSPTYNPTKSPTNNPTLTPSKYPSLMPTAFPTEYPTQIPTISPTYIPSKYPTTNPSHQPTNIPNTISPTIFPTNIPTQIPTTYPTITPTNNPTTNPTENPIPEPTPNPTPNPTKLPTTTPPTFLPTNFPSFNPISVSPTTSPSDYPSINPTQNDNIKQINTPQPTRRLMVNTNFNINSTIIGVGNGSNKYTKTTLWQRLGHIHILWYISTVALVILCCTLCLLVAFCLCVQRDIKSLSCNDGNININKRCSYDMELEKINNMLAVHGRTDCVLQQEDSPTKSKSKSTSKSIVKQMSNAASVGVDTKEEYDYFSGNDELREGGKISHDGHTYCEINYNGDELGHEEEEKQTICMMNDDIFGLKYHQIPSASCAMIVDMGEDDIVDDDDVIRVDKGCFIMEDVVQDEMMDDFEITNDINEYRRVSKLRGQSISIWSASDDGHCECDD